MPGLLMLAAVVACFMHRSASDVSEKSDSKMVIKSGKPSYMYVLWSILSCFIKQTKLMLPLK